jgi:hypothetical protein
MKRTHCLLAFRSLCVLALSASITMVQSGRAQTNTPLAAETLADPPPANQTEVGADIMVIHATNEGKGIDKRIGDLPQLKKPPFSAYNTYKLLNTHHVKLVKNKASSLKLPNDSLMKLLLKNVIKEKNSKDNRYKVATSITKPKGDKFLPLLEISLASGEYFFLAGQSYQKGILVMGIKLRNK